MDFEQMTVQELSDIIDQAGAEIARRQAMQAVNDEVAAVLRQARESGAVPTPTPGEPWKQPLGAHDAYMAGDVVTDEGITWDSTVDYNVWRPGVSGWKPRSEDGSPAPYQQPTGQHDAYNTGELITFEGDVYKGLQDGLVWSPADFPQGWEKQ